MQNSAANLTPLEIAKERAWRAVSYSVQNLISEPRTNAARKTANAAFMGAIYKYPTWKNLRWQLNDAIRKLEEIGLEYIPIYVSTLKSSFDLVEVRSCIETELERIYREFIKEALGELKSVGIRASQVVARADADFSTMKNRLYKELQMQSHELCVKNSKSRNSKPPPARLNITPVPDIKFVKDSKLKNFASTAAQEACRCFDAMAFNAAAVMAGSATESVLLDLLLQNKSKLKTGGKPLEEWRLVDLITTALKLNLLGRATGNLAQIVRQHRNLIHPGRSLREKNSIGRGEAEITLGILRLVCDELS